MFLQSPGFRAENVLPETDGVLRDRVAEGRPDFIVHLAARVGSCHSIDKLRSCADAYLVGTFNLLEAVRATPYRHLQIASISPVPGADTEMAYAETHKADSQMAFCSAAKKATGAMAHSWACRFFAACT